MVNILQVNTQTFLELTSYIKYEGLKVYLSKIFLFVTILNIISMLWSAPLQILLSVVFLWSKLGFFSIDFNFVKYF